MRFIAVTVAGWVEFSSQHSATAVVIGFSVFWSAQGGGSPRGGPNYVPGGGRPTNLNSEIGNQNSEIGGMCGGACGDLGVVE